MANTSVVRNWIMVATGLLMTVGTLTLANVQIRQARYQCENLYFQEHAQNARRVEVWAKAGNGTGIFMGAYYREQMLQADLRLDTGLAECRKVNQPLTDRLF